MELSKAEKVRALLLDSNAETTQQLIREFGSDVINNIRRNPKCNISNAFRKVTFAGAGSYGAAFAVCFDTGCQTKLVMKVIPFKDYSFVPMDVNNKNRPENSEYEIYKLLYDTFKRNGVTTHIAAPITSFICVNDMKINPVFASFLRDMLSRQTKQRVESLLKSRNYRVTISEFADMGSLLDVIESSTGPVIKQCVFQVIMITAILRKILPSFRHNDMYMPNFLARRMSNDLEYNFEGQQYRMSTNVAVLINDFDLSTVNGIPNIKYDYFIKRNLDIGQGGHTSFSYSDLFRFFSNMLVNHKEGGINLPADVLALAHFVVPDFLRGFNVHWNKTTNHIENHYKDTEPRPGYINIVYYCSLRADEKMLAPLFKRHNFDPSQREARVLLRKPIFNEYRTSSSKDQHVPQYKQYTQPSIQRHSTPPTSRVKDTPPKFKQPHHHRFSVTEDESSNQSSSKSKHKHSFSERRVSNSRPSTRRSTSRSSSRKRMPSKNTPSTRRSRSVSKIERPSRRSTSRSNSRPSSRRSTSRPSTRRSTSRVSHKSRSKIERPTSRRRSTSRSERPTSRRSNRPTSRRSTSRASSKQRKPKHILAPNYLFPNVGRYFRPVQKYPFKKREPYPKPRVQPPPRPPTPQRPSSRRQPSRPSSRRDYTPMDVSRPSSRRRQIESMDVDVFNTPMDWD